MCLVLHMRGLKIPEETWLGQGYLLTLDLSQVCNPEMPSASFSQLANREARAWSGEPWQSQAVGNVSLVRDLSDK